MKIKSVRADIDEDTVNIHNGDGVFINVIVRDGTITVYLSSMNSQVEIVEMDVNYNQMVIRYNKENKRKVS